MHERQLLPVPFSVSTRDAAAIPEVFITAWDALVVQGGLTSGRIAARARRRVGSRHRGDPDRQGDRGDESLVTASTGKVEACRALGADHVVDYTSEDFVAAALEFTGGRGVDVVLDVIGGEYLERNLDALATKGTIVQVGAMGSGNASFTLGKMLYKRARLIGTVLRARPLEEKAAISRRFGREMLPLFDQGLLKPVIDRHFSIDEVVDAHRYMESNANVGKILLDIDPCRLRFASGGSCSLRSTIGAARTRAAHCAALRLPRVDCHVVAQWRADVGLAGPRDLLVLVAEQLDPVRQPTRGAGDREQHREHLDREAHRLVDEARVEVDVRVELAADEVVVVRARPPRASARCRAAGSCP